MSNSSLLEKFNVLAEEDIIDRQIPKVIEGNLNPNFDIRPYQIDGLSRFSYYMNNYKNRVKPSHLLFHMATGSGKTLMMAGSILQLYSLGYRNFIFFVNSTNIIEKTKDNFLNEASSKYLFANKINIDGKNIKIKEVNNFELDSKNDINIIFTTIQGLYSKLKEPKENNLTYEDFENKEVVLIADEAHHINALTKRTIGKEEKKIEDSWEYAVQRIFNANPENVLIEFTATVETQHPAVNAKYHDKIFFEYTLKNFRRDRYSKEVKVLQADLDAKERVLQAIVLSQYRKKLAQKNHLYLKPVLLVKSKTIADSENFEKVFRDFIENLSVSDLANIKDKTSSDIVKAAFQFFEANDISLENLVIELQEDFSSYKSISVNSKSDTEAKQLILNSLEDRNNPIRIVFVVDKLNEGWDVLNLYDIVRIDESRGSKASTISEAQLIGRGARYFPFQFEATQDKYKRKFDEDAGNELKVLEEMYYHSINNARYISDLNTSLINSGIMPSKKVIVELNVKPEFKTTDFWSEGLLYTNKRIENDRRDIKNLKDLAIVKTYGYVLKTGWGTETTIMDSDLPFSYDDQVEEKAFEILKLGKTICRKAINQLDFYRFSNLKKYFPYLNSMDEFITSEEFLGQITVEVSGNKTALNSLSNYEKLKICNKVLKELAPQIENATTDYIGTLKFEAEQLSEKIKDLTLNISVNEDSSSEQQRGVSMNYNDDSEFRLNLADKPWHVYEDNFGTSEEKYLVKFINSKYEELLESYKNVYLIRNEKMFKIYNFNDGSPIEPDYVLYLEEENPDAKKVYQIFIEPKGTQLLEHDKKKEDFLMEIQENYHIDTLFEDEKYKIIGLPFYNEGLKKREFSEALNSI